MKTFYVYSTYIHQFLYTIVLVFGWGMFRWSKPPIKLFTVVFTLIYVVQLFSLVLGKLSINNLLLFHLLFAVQLIGYSLFYSKLLKGIQAKKGLSALFMLVLVLTCLEYVTNWAKLSSIFGGYAYFAFNMMCVILSACYLVQSTLRGERNAFWLINYGMLFYSGGSSIIFLFGERINELDFYVILLINIGLHIIFQFFYTAEVWKSRKS